jgi:hypothetical protein
MEMMYGGSQGIALLRKSDGYNVRTQAEYLARRPPGQPASQDTTRQTGRQTDRQTDRQADRQTDRQEDGKIEQQEEDKESWKSHGLENTQVSFRRSFYPTREGSHSSIYATS